jgi:hypothetical protein
MTKRLLAITISILLIISILPVIVLGTTSVTLELSQDSVTVGTSVTASGIADPVEWVSIKVVDSSGNVVFYDAIKSNDDGNYSCTFIVPPTVSPGTAYVVAGYGTNVDKKTLAITTSGGEPVAVTGVSLNKNSTIIVKDADETLVAMVEPANASNIAVNWSSNNESVATVDENGKVTGVSSGTAIITVTTEDGNKTADCNVTVTQPVTATSDQTIPISNIPVTIDVPQGVTSAIAVTQNTELPLVEVNSDEVNMTIPQGTEVSGSGTIQLPEVINSPSVEVPEAQAVELVIKVGSELETITFSKPVRLVLKGQAGKSAGFIDNQGNFKAIAKLESLDGLTSDADAYAVNDALDVAKIGEGAVTSGNDLIIWTKHFTEFIAYTPKRVDECFIATAAFGSKFEPAVVLLRTFRDTFLLTNAPGTAFVDFYYQNSPPVASYIANSGFLKAGVRALLTPVVGVVYLLFHPVLMYGIIGLLVFGIVIYRIRKRRVPSF